MALHQGSGTTALACVMKQAGCCSGVLPGMEYQSSLGQIFEDFRDTARKRDRVSPVVLHNRGRPANQ
jgi:hypothetical protein